MLIYKGVGVYFDDAVYFVTCKTKGNVPYFKERIFCEVFLENLRICKSLKQFNLFAWVLIYDHFHLLLQPNDGWNISEVMRSIKTNVSCDINRIFLPTEGAVPAPRLRLIYENKFDLHSFRQQSTQKYPNPIHIPFPKLQWQKSYHDHYMRNEKDFQKHLDYISYNPIKHGLSDSWPYVFTNPEYIDLIDMS
jgi:putative transposase